MSAADALKAARAAGVELAIDGDDLALKVASAPLAAILDLLSRHKAGIVALLRPDGDGWSAGVWHDFFDGRAGIAKYDGGLPRGQAEARAFACCMAEWLNRNFVRSPPGHCLACGGGDRAHDALLPFGIEPTGHAWLHSRCWPTWHAGRKAEAVAALTAMGIAAPADLPDDFGKNGGRMMGSFGSGRPGGSGRDTVEACRSIDVNRLHKKGCLRANWAGGWQWTHEGEKVASINLRAEYDRLHLSYRVCIGGGEWEDVAETVRIVRLPCRFGGARPYFICSGVENGIACGRCVVKLHGPGRYFLCRHCYRLAHASQSEGTWDRTLRRANKIKQRLGGDPGMAAPFPPKPMGMWRCTYDQLHEQAIEAEICAYEALAFQAECLLARIDKSKRKRRYCR